MSAIFLLPVYLTSRKCVTWCVPHYENFHQVWSWYDQGCSGAGTRANAVPIDIFVWERRSHCQSLYSNCDSQHHPKRASATIVVTSYDHPLPIVIALLLLIRYVTLTFDLLTLVSGHARRVTWSTPPPSLKILRLSVLELPVWVLTSPIYDTMRLNVCSHCACAVSRDLCAAANFSHIFEIPDPDLPIHYITFLALR